ASVALAEGYQLNWAARITVTRAVARLTKRAQVLASRGFGRMVATIAPSSGMSRSRRSMSVRSCQLPVVGCQFRSLQKDDEEYDGDAEEHGDGVTLQISALGGQFQSKARSLRDEAEHPHE